VDYLVTIVMENLVWDMLMVGMIAGLFYCLTTV